MGTRCVVLLGQDTDEEGRSMIGLSILSSVTEEGIGGWPGEGMGRGNGI